MNLNPDVKKPYYNTDQEHLKLREYGRNLQRLVAELPTISDKVVRTQRVQFLLKVMATLYANSTNSKLLTESVQKNWDDLCILADYELDVDSPYPIPSKRLLVNKPRRLDYQKRTIKYRHCGYHVELFVQKLLKVTEPIQRTLAITKMAKLIKSFSTAWNKDNLDAQTIVCMIQEIAGPIHAPLVGSLQLERSLNHATTSLTVGNRQQKPKLMHSYSQR